MDTYSFSQIISILSGFLCFSLGVSFYFKKTDSYEIKTFSMLAVSAALWVLSLVVYYNAGDSSNLIFFSRLNFAFAALVAFFCFKFGYIFPRVSYSISHLVHLLVLFETVALCVMTVATDVIVNNELTVGAMKSMVKGEYYWWFLVHMLVLSIGGIYLIYSKTKKFTGSDRQQSYILLAGLAVGLFSGLVTNILLPRGFGIEAASMYGSLALFPLIFASAVAVAKHSLFNIKVVISEFLIICILLIQILSIVLSLDPTTQVVLSASFVMTLIIGIFLINNVRKEIEDKIRLDAASQALAVANEKLKETDEIKNEFITMASHQLRTPISVVKGYLSLMLEGAYGQVPDAVRDKLQQIFGLNDRLVQMIDNMLNVARIEKRKVEYRIEHIDILSIVRSVLDEMRIKADEKNLTIKLELPDQPMMAHVDEEKFFEVVSNIMDNAIKYTDSGEIVISVLPDTDDGFVHVRVKDKGIGMTPEEIGRTFTKFFRAKEAVIREPGTGLGLFICSKFMHGMGGDIRVLESLRGNGTTFEITAAVNRSDVADDSIIA